MNDTMITIVGNLVDRPLRRVLDNGTSVTNFRVASTSRRYDRESGSYVDRDTLFVKVTCWRQIADNVARSLVQGDPVVVTGRCYSRSYEVGGVTKISFEMEASGIGPDLNRGQAEFRRVRRDVPAGDVVGAAPQVAPTATVSRLPDGITEVVGELAAEGVFERMPGGGSEEPALAESGTRA